MIIISWDVGIIHLAYCVLKYIFDEELQKATVEIIDWDEINLIEDDRIKLECCGKMKAKKDVVPKICGKNATYCLTREGESFGFCKMHLSQSDNYWSEKQTRRLFKQLESDNNHSCTYLKNTGSLCDKKCKYIYRNGKDKIYYCTAHYKSELNKKIKELSPLLIKNLIVKKYPTSQLQLNLIKKLDLLSKHFAKLGIEEVIIENQPSQKNPKMKSISNTLFDYFLIRGYIDKIHNMDIKLVRFICPSNKLKVNNDNTIEVFKANKDTTKKYKLTKALGIEYTKKLIDENQLTYLELYKKKDDICDAYLQGRYYLEFIRNKDDVPKIKSKSKSKSESKSKSKKRNNLKTDKKQRRKKSTRKLNNGNIIIV